MINLGLKNFMAIDESILNEMRNQSKLLDRISNALVSNANKRLGKKNRLLNNDITESTDGIKKEFDKLKNELKHQNQAVEESRVTFSKITKALIAANNPIAKIGQVFKDTEKTLKESTKRTDDAYKNVSQGTYKFFENIIKSGKDSGQRFEKELGNIVKTQSDFFEKLDKIDSERKKLDNTKLDKLKETQLRMESEKMSIMSRLRGKTGDELRLVKEEYTKKRAELKSLDDLIEQEEENRIKINDNLQNFNKELSDVISTLEDLQLKGIKSFEGVKASTLANIKAGKATAEELNKTKKQIQKNMGAVLTGAEAAGGLKGQLVSKLSDAAGTIVTGLKTSLAALWTKAAPQLINDVQARGYYGVNESLGMSSIQNNLGLSEKERAELVGKNQTLFRVMGKGDINEPFKTGQFNKMQNALIDMFKFSKEQAAEKVVEYQTTVMESGFAPTLKNLQKFSENLKITNAITGEAPDVINDFYKSMQDTGQMALLQQAFSNKSELERLDILQKNTSSMILMNRSLGLNAAEMKQLNQRAMEQKYAGLVEQIRSVVGTQIGIGGYNAKHGTNYTAEQFARGKMMAAGNATDTETFIVNEMKRKGTDRKTIEKELASNAEIYRNVTAERAEAQNAGNLTSIAAGNVLAAGRTGAANAFTQEIAGQLSPDFGMSESQKMLNAKLARARGQGTDKGQAAIDTDLAGALKGQSISEITAQQIKDSTDIWTKRLDEAGVAVSNFKTLISQITEKNPLGAAAGGLIGGVGDIAKSVIVGKILFGGGGGTAAGGLLGKAAGWLGRGAAAGGIGAQGTAAAGTATSVGLTTAAGVTAAAAAGYATGTLANKAWDSTDVGKKINDSINDIASNGIEAAAMKIRAMADPLYAMQMASLPHDKTAAIASHRNALSYLNDSVGKENLQKWSGNNSDRTILSQMKSGTLSYSDLKNAGASEEFIKGLTEAYADDPQTQKMLEKLEDIFGVLKDSNDHAKSTEKKEQYRFDTAQAIQDRLKRRIDDAFTASKNSVTTVNSFSGK